MPGDAPMEAARKLISEVRRQTPLLTSREELLPRQLAAAALARAVALLEGLCSLKEDDLTELEGILARAVWECWMVGLYLVLAPDEAAGVLAGDYRRNARAMADKWPQDGESWTLEVPDVPEARLNFELLTTRVSDLLRAQGGASQVWRTHSVTYRGTSMVDAHANYMTLMRYIEPTDNRLDLRDRARPFFPEGHIIEYAAMNVGHLATYVFREFSVSATTVADIVNRLAR